MVGVGAVALGRGGSAAGPRVTLIPGLPAPVYWLAAAPALYTWPPTPAPECAYTVLAGWLAPVDAGMLWVCRTGAAALLAKPVLLGESVGGLTERWVVGAGDWCWYAGAAVRLVGEAPLSCSALPCTSSGLCCLPSSPDSHIYTHAQASENTFGMAQGVMGME